MGQDKSDSRLFQEAMQDVNPLKYEKKVPLTPPYLFPVPKQRYLDEALVHKEMLSDHYEPAELEIGDELLFVRAGIQRIVL